LKIAEIRKYLPGINILALTATATPVVVDDIQEKLEFKEKNVFKKSFERENLIYIVQHTIDKYGQMLKLINAVRGTGIVYVRSRKLTEKIALFLKSHNISADFYHAGLSPKEKDKKQDEWKNDITRVIVATNAFGMGIDKPDVRFVIHIDLPDSLEAYFQEAGRGGRDLNDAFAFLLYNEEDIENLRNSHERAFSPKETIFAVYEAFCNYSKIPVGAGKNQNYELVITNFAREYNFSPIDVYNSLKFLEKDKYLEYTEDIFIKSEVHFLMNRSELYKFQVENQSYDSFVNFLLRTYTGMFAEYVSIDEYWISNSTKTPIEIVFKLLSGLANLNVIDYIPQKTTPFVTLIEDRVHPKSFSINKENYDFLKKNYKEKIEAVIDYVSCVDKCRSRILLEYFGQNEIKNCGRCDICYHKIMQKNEKSDLTLKIMDVISDKEVSIRELAEMLSAEENELINIVKELLDNRVLILTEQRKLKLKE
jgi:ATP-dependent DNA helicase RecQ